ncbi:MAG: hypothetical protein KF770_09385 [Anaerolineae bacterium]|nr:hypothetical protein [Anaerolineae bacterium]
MSVPGDGRVGDIRSNALWLCHVAALAQAAAAWYGGRIAADVLNAMAAESDEAWRGLYAEIMTLVKLDVSQASQQRPVAYSSSGNPTTARLPEPEKETLITLATEAGALALTEEELLAMAVSRESELQAFFDHIRQRLPGNLIPSSPGSPRDQVTQSLPNRKWAPDRRTRVQFINLVKKYIASLQNPHFRQHTAVRDGFIYYVIFQRIIWLLHTHQGLDMANCLDFWRAINEHFFGTASSLPPVASPLLRQQCRFAWHEDWQDTAVPLYALANLWQIEQLLAQQPDSLPSHQWPTEKWRLLALLRVVVDWDDLRHSLEEMTPVAEASHLYEQPAEEMALALLALLDTDLTAVADILEQWIAGVAFDPQQVIEPQQAALLYQANVDYRRALFHIYKQMDETTKQQQIVSDLIFWARRAGAREESYRWQERLIALYRADGDDRAMAMTFYRQAQQYLRDREFTLAERLAQEGLALANQLQDEPMKEKYGRLLSNISFLAG